MDSRLAGTMCTNVAVMVTAVFMGLEKAAKIARVPVVKMWSSLPQIIEGYLGDEDGGLFSNTLLFF